MKLLNGLPIRQKRTKRLFQQQRYIKKATNRQEGVYSVVTLTK